MKRLLPLFAAALLFAAPSHANDKPSDAAALRGVSTGKVVWDISMADPDTLAVFLSVVRETYDDLVRQNVRPDMVLAIHGAPVRFVRVKREDLPFEAGIPVDEINGILDDLASRSGVRVEVCSVANRLFGVENASIKPNFHVVGNTWVSLIGYQAQGYAVVPID